MAKVAAEGATSMRVRPRHMGLLLAALVLVCACRASERTYVLHDVDGGALPYTMFTYAGDKHSQILWSTLRWRADGRVEHQFQYRSLNADGTADTLGVAVDVYEVDEEERRMHLSRWAPALTHSVDSVRLTDTLARDGQHLLWAERIRLGDGLPDDSVVTRTLRFTKP